MFLFYGFSRKHSRRLGYRKHNVDTVDLKAHRVCVRRKIGFNIHVRMPE